MSELQELGCESEASGIRIKPCSSHRLTRQVVTTCVTRIQMLYSGPRVIVELDEKMTLR